MPASSLSALRACIERLERQAPVRLPARARAVCGFGLAALDARFAGGGLAAGAHEMAGLPGEGAAALLFAGLVLARRLRTDPGALALVVQDADAAAEGGGVYGPGLLALGLDPGRLACVVARDGAETLRITDEAVRSGAAAAVLTEFGVKAARRLDLAMTQRFNVFAARTGVLALLVVPEPAATSAALSRWRVATAPSPAPASGPAARRLGPPALTLNLTRNRHGPVGRFDVEWSREDEAFRLRTPLRPSVARAPLDGPGARRSTPPGSPGAGGDRARRLAAAGGG